jgi:hypothetical protein
MNRRPSACLITSWRPRFTTKKMATALHQRIIMQLTPISASTATQSSQLLNLFEQNALSSQAKTSGSGNAAQFNQVMNQLDSTSGASAPSAPTSGTTTSPSTTGPATGSPAGTPVHHHHGHHHVSGGDLSSPSDMLSAMLSQSGNMAQSSLPASMTTNTTALDPTSLFGA